MPEVISLGGKLIAWQEINERTKGPRIESMDKGYADLVRQNLDENFPLIYGATNTDSHPNLLPVLAYLPDGYNAASIAGLKPALDWHQFRPEDEYQRSPVLCYPLLKAPTLKSYLNSNTPLGLSEGELLEYYSRLCLGCHHLHSHGLVHRNITPGNILVKFPDNVELLNQDPGDLKFEAVNYHMEFGSNNFPEGAKPQDLVLFDHELVGKIGDADEAWKAGAGTPGYISPEQVGHYSKPQATTDIYSLGLLFAKLYTNEFTGKSFPDVDTTSPISDELANQLSTIPFLKPRIIEVLEGATAIEPSNRYQDIPTFLADLQNAFKN